MFLKSIENKITYFIKKITEFPLIKINDQIVQNKTIKKIPNNLYQTWENNLFGKTHYKEMIKFRSINKDLNFYLFDRNKRDDYMKKNWGDHKISENYDKSKFGQIKADIFRYCILYEYGGYYFDISKGCKVSITSLHNHDTEALISYEPIECVIPPDRIIFNKLKYPLNNFLQWGFGFKKNHPILLSMIDNITQDYKNYKNISFEKPKSAILAFSGTGQFTKVVREYILKKGVENIEQANIYFNGNGIFSMRGSRVRHLLVKEYADVRNQPIIS